MRKIRCPECAVVNLERFVTYPHCAGCGALLPQAEGVPEQLPRIRRPIKPLLWAAALGISIVSLVGGVVFLDSSPPVQGQWEVYGRAPRFTVVGKAITADLTLEAADSVASRRDTMLHGVQVRVSEQLFHSMRFLGVEPRPDDQRTLGKGRYFYYNDFPLGGTFRLRLVPFHAGYASFDAQMYADKRIAGNFSAPIVIRK